MGTRIELQHILEEILGSSHVYFQPPESIKLKYPANVYSLLTNDTKKADDGKFLHWPHYRVQLISRDPDNKTVYDILNLQHCSYAGDRFVVDNLYHDNFDLYF